METKQAAKENPDNPKLEVWAKMSSKIADDSEMLFVQALETELKYKREVGKDLGSLVNTIRVPKGNSQQ
jgi:hypothetical protein